MAATATAALRKYRKLIGQKEELAAALEKVKKEIIAAEKPVIDWFQKEGVPGITVEGKNIHIRREVWPKRDEGVTTEQLCENLVAYGGDLADMVKPGFNTRTLQSYVRELEKKGLPLPEIEGVSFPEVFKIGVTAGREMPGK